MTITQFNLIVSIKVRFNKGQSIILSNNKEKKSCDIRLGMEHSFVLQKISICTKSSY